MPKLVDHDFSLQDSEPHTACLLGHPYLTTTLFRRLVERPGEPVSREELRQILWPGGPG